MTILQQIRPLAVVASTHHLIHHLTLLLIISMFSNLGGPAANWQPYVPFDLRGDNSNWSFDNIAAIATTVILVASTIKQKSMAVTKQSQQVPPEHHRPRTVVSNNNFDYEGDMERWLRERGWGWTALLA